MTLPNEKFISVSKHDLFMVQTGQGKPTIILEAGAGEDSTTWRDVIPALAQFSQVVAYDRAGLGRSVGTPPLRTALQLVDDLHSLLEAAQLEGPYLLVGHSLGAVLCRLYTQQYRHEVAGLVLIDGPHPDQGKRFTAALTETGWHEHELVRPILEMASGIAPELHPDRLDFAKSMAEVDQTQTFGDLPLVVISATKLPAEAWPDLPIQAALAFTQTWDTMQSELPNLSTRGVHLITRKSGHYIHCDEPELVVEAIRQMAKTIGNYSET